MVHRWRICDINHAFICWLDPGNVASCPCLYRKYWLDLLTVPQNIWFLKSKWSKLFSIQECTSPSIWRSEHFMSWASSFWVGVQLLGMNIMTGFEFAFHKPGIGSFCGRSRCFFETLLHFWWSKQPKKSRIWFINFHAVSVLPAGTTWKSRQYDNIFLGNLLK